MTRKFTKDHEWLDMNGTIATVGITEYAVAQLGDVVFVEQPEVGKSFAKGDGCGVVESTKAASDVYAPLSGTITEVNDKIVDDPSLLNADAENTAWFFKIEFSDASELDDLLSEEEYKKLIG